MNEQAEMILKYPHKLGRYLGYGRLKKFHSTWIKNAWQYNKKKYVLQAHRNSYKTTAVIVVGAIWYLLFNPDATILIIRKEATGANSTLKEITKHMQSDKLKFLFNLLYGMDDFGLTKSNADSIEISCKGSITKEGSIDTLGIGGAITGRHYDIILADDIITLKDRASHAEREKTKDFVRELNNVVKIGGKIIITGTPWHLDDAFKILPEPDKYPLGTLNIPEFTKEQINDIRQSMPVSLFAINYLLKHTADEDKPFSEVQFDRFDNSHTTIAQVDPAYEGKDTTALTIAYEKNGNLYVTGFVYSQSIVELYKKLAQHCIRYRVQKIVWESNGDKGLSAKQMRTHFPRVIDEHEKQNKEQKIALFLKKNFNRVYINHHCQEAYLSQVMEYQFIGGAHDDAPDSLASLIRHMKIGEEKVNADNFGVYEEYQEFLY